MRAFKIVKKAFWETMFLLFPKWAICYISKQEFKEKLMDPAFNSKQIDRGVNPYFKNGGSKCQILRASTLGCVPAWSLTYMFL